MVDTSVPVFPITGFSLAYWDEHDVMVLRLPFLAHSMQTPEEADPGRTYVLSLGQAEDLMRSLNEGLRRAGRNVVPLRPDRH